MLLAARPSPAILPEARQGPPAAAAAAASPPRAGGANGKKMEAWRRTNGCGGGGDSPPPPPPAAQAPLLALVLEENARLQSRLRWLEEEFERHRHRCPPTAVAPRGATTNDRSKPAASGRPQQQQHQQIGAFKRKARTGSTERPRVAKEGREGGSSDKEEERDDEEAGAAAAPERRRPGPRRRHRRCVAPLHDVEAHQSSQGLHHRRAGPPPPDPAAAGPARAPSTGPPAAARPVRVAVAMGEGGGPGEGGGGDDDDDGDGERSSSRGPGGVGEASSSSFASRVRDRAGWLVGLLVLQSASSFIISRNEALLQSHLVIVQFLTMLVGAGGNAGNQASVRVIRGLATGTVNDRNARTFLLDEIKMGVALSALLGAAGFARAAAFAVPPPETLAITASLSAIVFLSIVLGAVLPLAMSRMRIDPAHSSTTIQVLMDILGVTITVVVSGAILDSPVSAQ